MFIEFDKVWSWFQNAGFPDKAKKWVAWTFIVGAAMFGLFWISGYFGSKGSPLTTSPPMVVPPSATPLSVPVERRSDAIPTSPSCAIALKAGRDYNFDDGTHQLEAWRLFEQALTQLSPNEKATVNMRLVEEARRDWQKGPPKVALNKFRAAFSCESVSKP